MAPHKEPALQLFSGDSGYEMESTQEVTRASTQPVDLMPMRWGRTTGIATRHIGCCSMPLQTIGVGHHLDVYCIFTCRQLKSERPTNPCPDPWWIPEECQGAFLFFITLFALHSALLHNALQQCNTYEYGSAHAVAAAAKRAAVATGEERVKSRSTWDECQEFFEKVGPVWRSACMALLSVLSDWSQLIDSVEHIVSFWFCCAVRVHSEVPETLQYPHQAGTVHILVMTLQLLPCRTGIFLVFRRAETVGTCLQGKIPKNKKGRRLLMDLML